jgi:hypothetical protein
LITGKKKDNVIPVLITKYHAVEKCREADVELYAILTIALVVDESSA